MSKEEVFFSQQGAGVLVSSAGCYTDFACMNIWVYISVILQVLASLRNTTVKYISARSKRKLATQLTSYTQPAS